MRKIIKSLRNKFKKAGTKNFEGQHRGIVGEIALIDQMNPTVEEMERYSQRGGKAILSLDGSHGALGLVYPPESKEG